ncbi:related to epoxide hydrolase [Ramularia collo-cygni]|uniref:Related to epoxide hydrolase n=1 Tax=Ramularia collo-cygni TaxID=112498 RepID=A0A2D3ULR6_9PEZI|nr:related to epoxide hydrolase [Ramularia collo-cygni]CZT14161.1 related to epoxide hydrolase [Ramularia collo-cygni]
MAFEPLPLPDDISEDYLDCTSSCGLNFHILKAGEAGRPLILFCHGYPELAFSWRKILPAVAKAGYYCVAMDQRGYGRTTGWDDKPYHEVDLAEYTITNLVRDLVCLTYRLGYTDVACIIGHDFGAVSSAMAALIRPDIFKATIQMSHPHHALPTPQLGDKAKPPPVDIQADLAKLSPPRKHYKWYNSTAGAANDWDHPSQGLEKYLRGYFHLKSADWDKNDPHPLKEWSAKEIEVMPEYYVMAKDDSFPQTVEKSMKGEDYSKTESWLPADDLRVYVQEWSRTGFQGALNWYRAQTASTPQSKKDMLLYAGRRIEVPCTFISGKQDWGNFQQPGAFEAYEDEKCVRPGCFKGTRLIDHAGHWVQQEQSQAVTKEVLDFLKGL